MWIPHLRRQTLASDSTVVLDPGSICWLTEVGKFGSEITRSRKFEAWWPNFVNGLLP